MFTFIFFNDLTNDFEREGLTLFCYLNDSFALLFLIDLNEEPHSLFVSLIVFMGILLQVMGLLVKYHFIHHYLILLLQLLFFSVPL